MAQPELLVRSLLFGLKDVLLPTHICRRAEHICDLSIYTLHCTFAMHEYYIQRGIIVYKGMWPQRLFCGDTVAPTKCVLAIPAMMPACRHYDTIIQCLKGGRSNPKRVTVCIGTNPDAFCGNPVSASFADSRLSNRS